MSARERSPSSKLRTLTTATTAVSSLDTATTGGTCQLEYAEKTLQYLRQLWGREIALETIVNDKKSLLCFADDKLTIKPVH